MIRDDFDAGTADELRAEAAAARRFLGALRRHPDPRDPDYPGDPSDEQESD